MAPVAQDVKVEVKAEDEPVLSGARRGRPSKKTPEQPGAPKRAWPCDWANCNKSFSRRSDLTRHGHIHTHTRPHPCTEAGCNKRFIQTSALTVHKRIHTGEKPYACKFASCTKRFNDSSSLTRHAKIHTRPRNISCKAPGCQEKFPHKTALRRHVSREHTKRPRGIDSRRTEPDSDLESINRANATSPCESLVDHDPQKHPAFYAQGSESNMSSWQRHGGRCLSSLPTTARRQQQQQQQQQQSHLPIGVHTFLGRCSAGRSRAPLHPDSGYVGQTTYQYLSPMASPVFPHDQHTRDSTASSPISMHLSVPPPQRFHEHLPSYNTIYQDQFHGMVHSVPMQHAHLDPANHGYMNEMAIEPGSQARYPLNQIEEALESLDIHYQSPQDGGIVTVHQQYSLPAISLGLSMDDDDKFVDTFGDPLPSQIIE